MDVVLLEDWVTSIGLVSRTRGGGELKKRLELDVLPREVENQELNICHVAVFDKHNL